MTDYLSHMQTVGNDTAFARRVDYLRHNYRSLLDNLDRERGSVLEIGPGYGELPHLLNSLGITNIDLVDNDKSVLDYCMHTYQLNNVIHTKGGFSSKIKGKYDLIVLTQVFEHLPKKDYLVWIKGLYGLLKPGGQIVITVPNGANPLVGTERYGDLQHENIFTIYSFQELMTFASLIGADYTIKGFEIPPSSLLNIIRIFLQKLLHAFFILLMMVNGAIYQTLMTPNITLIINRKK